VLSCLRPADLAAAEGACQRWRSVVHADRLWRRHALSVGVLPQPARSLSGGAWKQLCLEAQV
jgi:hypothetical protein